MVRPCASTRILPRLVLVSPIVAAFPSGAFGGAGAAVALLLLPPPQAATDNAASGTASATARRLMGLRRLIATLREVVGFVGASGLRSLLSSATGRLFGLPLKRDSDHARTPVAPRASRAPRRTAARSSCARRGEAQGSRAGRPPRPSRSAQRCCPPGQAHVDVEHAMDLLASGERTGYLLKTRVTDVADFVATLERIAKGASVVDPALVQELVAARRVQDPLDALSPREREVLALMAEGRSNAGIAHQLWVTEGTVEKHIHSILQKLPLQENEDDHRRVLAVLAFLETR